MKKSKYKKISTIMVLSMFSSTLAFGSVLTENNLIIGNILSINAPELSVYETIDNDGRKVIELSRKPLGLPGG